MKKSYYGQHDLALRKPLTKINFGLNVAVCGTGKQTIFLTCRKKIDAFKTQYQRKSLKILRTNKVRRDDI